MWKVALATPVAGSELQGEVQAEKSDPSASGDQSSREIGALCAPSLHLVVSLQSVSCTDMVSHSYSLDSLFFLCIFSLIIAAQHRPYIASLGRGKKSGLLV